MRLSEARRDIYRRRAKKEGYRSRSAYKLLQIDKKYRILKKGQTVIDFGAAPGGWMQASSKKVGPEGLVLGVDTRFIPTIAENTFTIKNDIFNETIVDDLKKLLVHKSDVVLSDLAPDVTGIWQIDHLKQIDLVSRVVELLPTLLRPGGSVVMKIFEGEATKSILKKIRRIFDKVLIYKPPASRSPSSELYFVCLNYQSL